MVTDEYREMELPTQSNKMHIIILNPLMENKSFKSNILEKKKCKNPDDYDKQNVIAIIYRELRLITIAPLFLISHGEKIPRIKEVVLQASHLGR
jgi:hypothetical protein